MNPKVSVLMSVYNGEKYVAEAIESILRQTFADFEFLITDDGSTDSSLTIIESYAQRDSRIRVAQNQTNIGLGNTRNRMFEIARGEYFAMADADDIYREERLALQVEYLDTHPEIGVVGSWMQLFRGKYRYTPRAPTTDWDIKSHLLVVVPIQHSTVMLRSHLVGPGRLQYNDAMYRHAEDYQLWVEASEITRFAAVPYALVDYRLHTTQSTNKFATIQRQNHNRIASAHLTRHNVTPECDIALHIAFGQPFSSKEDMAMTRRTIRNIIAIHPFYQYSGVSNRFKRYLRRRFRVSWVRTVLRMLVGLTAEKIWHRLNRHRRGHDV